MDALANVLLGALGAAILAAGAAVSASIIAGRISNATKIAEFRQAWIDKLREDIAKYVGAVHQWIRKYEELNDLPSSEHKREKERNELFPIANKARVILWRIRMRLNPRENENKAEDDAFLASLLDLLDPGKLPAGHQTEAAWMNSADQVVEQAREILKREWEVTKRRP
jgi:hypothetical protein